MSSLHPSLARMYGTANPQSEFLFVDESYTTPQEGLNSAFYLLTAVKFSYADLPGVRADLQDIAGGDYWHTTEALQTQQGAHTFEEFLDYFCSEADPSFITCKTSLTTHYSTENARQDCLRALMDLSVPSSGGLAGVVFEKRNVARDRGLFIRGTQQPKTPTPSPPKTHAHKHPTADGKPNAKHARS